MSRERSLWLADVHRRGDVSWCKGRSIFNGAGAFFTPLSAVSMF
jgi:hypothetical protein